MIPHTIYLTPQQTLSRDTWYIKQNIQNPSLSNDFMRHSVSDFVSPPNNTLCMIDAKKLDAFAMSKKRTVNRSVSPPSHVFLPLKEEDSSPEKCASIFSTVSHSVSMPAHLSKSHQNILKVNHGDLENVKPAKRTVRKKGLFNCSLFRKRSTSHSKSREKITDVKSPGMRGRPQSKSLNRSVDKSLSILSDRCVTLPNLKSSEVDLTQNINQHQLISMDLIKDYLNRSDNSLQSTVQRNSVDCGTGNSLQPFSASVQNSPHSSSICKYDLKQFKQVRLCDSMILETPSLSQSLYSQQSASSDRSHSMCLRTTSPLTINSAFDHVCFAYSTGTPTSNENAQPPCLRQISAPIYYNPPQSTHQYLSPPPTNSAFEFWTRPYHEKMKASRRRLLDDKVGSKEALLRSLSPHNLKTNEGIAVYDNPYHLHIITEPTTNLCSDSQNCNSQFPNSTNNNNDLYSVAQYHLSNHDKTSQEYGSRTSASPVIENRLSESPISCPKRQNDVYQRFSNKYLTYNKDFKDEGEMIQSKKEIIEPNLEKILPFQRTESITEMKDNKSFNSSSDLVLTRTPTPPHSFAESSVSSVYPAPNEFISDPNKSQCNTARLCGTVNLLYTSDNSEDENDDFSPVEIEPIPPLPPPRTDSVMRSLQAQLITDADKSELEYDISDEFPPVFSGANIDRCDIEQYHKWLEKLPYKLKDFHNILQCRKSSVSACKISPMAENLNSICKEVDLAVLKQFKESRKSIKSWNASQNSKPHDSSSLESNETINLDLYAMKKAFSYDQSLNNFEVKCISENSSFKESNQQIPTVETALLKQYSHLYSLKPSPSQTPKLIEFKRTGLKCHKSKSIDLRNIIHNVSDTSISILEKFTQKRKSVPNTNFSHEATSNELSGKSKLHSPNKCNPEYKMYPML